MNKKPNTTNFKVIADNRKARFDYEIVEQVEAGLALMGTEVKSLRLGRASIKEAYAREKDGELWLLGCNISEYPAAGRFNHDPTRLRKLLLHRKEINRLMGQVQRAGMTIVPLTLYFNDRGIVKCSIGLARGKNKADKRDTEKKRDWERQKGQLLRQKH